MRPKLFKNFTRNRIVICGSDSLALRLTEELLRLEEPVTVVVDDVTNHFAVKMANLGSRIVEGPARDIETLRAAGVDRATAIALLDPDDVDNVHAALTAQELNPALRLVMRVYNVDLGERINTLFEDCVVLSPGEIAAPAFVDLVLGDGNGHVVWAGDTALQAGPPDTMREVYTALAAETPDGLALLPNDTHAASLVLGPLPDNNPAPARKITTTAKRARKAPKPLRGAWGGLRAVWRAGSTPRAKITLGWFAALCLLASVIFQIGLGGGWMDAFYRTITIVTSTGYDDLLDANAPSWIKLFGAVIMLAGVLIMAIVTAIIVDGLIDERVAQRLGKLVEEPTDHIVVCGLGAVGLRVAEGLLKEGHQVVGIELDASPAVIAIAKRLGVPVISGDAGEEEILRAAGVPHARCVVAITNDDITNLQAGLGSKDLAPNVSVVLRLFDSDLADRVETQLNVGTSRSVSMLAAPVFAAALVGREITGVIPFRRRVLLVARVCVTSLSAMNNVKLALMDVSGEIRILALTRDGTTTWCPNLATVLQPGDDLTVIATRAGLTRAIRLTGMSPSLQDPKRPLEPEGSRS